MALDVRALAGDKRVRIAAIGGAGIGAVVLLRRKATGQGTAAAVGTASVPASTGGGGAVYGGSSGVPSFSDGGSQFSADLGNFQTGLQGILTEYTSTLNDTLTSLKAVPSGTSDSPGTSTPAKPSGLGTLTAPDPKNTATNYGWFTSLSNNNTLAAVAKAQNTTVEAIKALNPGISNQVKAGEVVRVRPNATPTYVAPAPAKAPAKVTTPTKAPAATVKKK